MLKYNCPTLNVGVYGSKNFMKVFDKMLFNFNFNYFSGCRNEGGMSVASVRIELTIERSNVAFRDLTM